MRETSPLDVFKAVTEVGCVVNLVLEELHDSQYWS